MFLFGVFMLSQRTGNRIRPVKHKSLSYLTIIQALALTLLMLTGCAERGKPGDQATAAPEGAARSKTKQKPQDSAQASPADMPQPSGISAAPQTTGTAVSPADQADSSSLAGAASPVVVDDTPETNRLGNETSPYLRGAAKSPVNWRPWNSEAFARAQSLNRPILISIGACWCGACRLMDDSTYQDKETVAFINDNFVAIKTDADERPDISGRYKLLFSMVNNRQSALPLTVFALPDGRAFDVLGYVPARTNDGQKSMTDILQQVLVITRDRRADAEKQAEAYAGKLAQAAASHTPGEISGEVLKKVEAAIGRQFDAQNTGFGPADGPKDPGGAALLFLLHYYSDYNDPAALDMVTKTLNTYVRCGLRDHVLGGYFRMSANGKFTRPSYEKMLHVQAQLLSAYSLAHAATGKALYKETALEILKFMRDTFEAPDGGFYASQAANADPDDQCAYFTHTPAEIEKIAGKGNDTAVFMRYLNIGTDGNKDTAVRSAAYSDKPLQAAADALKISRDDAQKSLDSARKKLYDERMARETVPYVDKSLYTSWNAMMACAYFDAYKYLGLADPRDFAIKTTDLMLNKMVSETDGVAHVYAKGRASVYGLLADQTLLAAALIQCFEVTGKKEYFDTAESLMNFVEAKYLDKASGLYFDRDPATTSSDGLLMVTGFDWPENAGPSGNAVAAMVWYQLYMAANKEEYKTRAERIVKAIAGTSETRSANQAVFGQAMALVVNGAPKAMIIAEDNDPMKNQMRNAALPVFRMGKLVETLSPLEAKGTMYPPAKDGMAIAYICTAENCAPPVRKAADIANVLKTFGKPADANPTTSADKVDAPAAAKSSGEPPKSDSTE